MPNYTYGYYYFKRRVTIKNNGDKIEGYFYVGLRLNTLHMETQAIRNALGFQKQSEIVGADRGVTIDVEKTFHCAASKGLVGHLAFTLEPQNPAQVSPKWGNLFETSLTFLRTQGVDNVKTFLYGHAFPPPGGGDAYRVVAGSIKERRRRGQ